jgi:hypothetical protein
MIKMFTDFYNDKLDIKRLNYGVITLVPKLKKANNIKHFRLICLLNVDFKCFTKVLTNRHVPVAKKIMSKNHSGFVKGRNILEQVMIGKGFPRTWISWVMKIVKDGKVCINVNGERSPYFKTFRGLRQGDPLSPLLFNLVADVLGVLLDKASQKGHIKGVLEDLVPGGITHI